MQAQKLDRTIADNKKQISTYQMEKQNLEQTVVERAKQMGFVTPPVDSTIYVPVSSEGTDGDNN
jgi:hypothetical protein